MISATQALARLREGNRRYVSESSGGEAAIGESRRNELSSGQAPFAVILGCSDSRAPAEIVFDQGLGDLFVIRVAGNIIAPSVMGSVEYAPALLGTRLIVVMGHSNCGAVHATLDQLQRGAGLPSPNLQTLVDCVRPGVEPLVEGSAHNDHDALVAQAVRANVRASANQLRHGSPLLENLIANDGLLVVGAEYSLETGVVDFFDGLPT